jgi:two-component system LytT family sensor kinase
MNSRRIVYYHIIGWLIYVLYLTVGQFFEATRTRYPLFNYSLTFVQFVQFYICYLWVYPRFFKRGKVLQLVLGILVSIAAFVMLRYLIEEMAFRVLFRASNYSANTPLWQYALDNIYWGTSFVFISAAVWSSFEAIKRERENKSLREEMVKAELAFLKSQINPHFLYNTLNYIYSLAYPVSEKLADAVIRLSQLMRYMLTDSADGMVALQNEADYIQNYIEIYRLRFEDSFFVDLSIEGNLENKRIAALMLIPFVENAFKHGVVDDPHRPVKIQLKLTGNRLIFTVSNKINRNEKDPSSGIGLINIRRRLELIYPDKHELLVSANGQTYKATLNIQL